MKAATSGALGSATGPAFHHRAKTTDYSENDMPDRGRWRTYGRDQDMRHQAGRMRFNKRCLAPCCSLQEKIKTQNREIGKITGLSHAGGQALVRFTQRTARRTMAGMTVGLVLRSIACKSVMSGIMGHAMGMMRLAPDGWRGGGRERSCRFGPMAFHREESHGRRRKPCGQAKPQEERSQICSYKVHILQLISRTSKSPYHGNRDAGSRHVCLFQTLSAGYSWALCEEGRSRPLGCRQDSAFSPTCRRRGVAKGAGRRAARVTPGGWRGLP